MSEADRSNILFITNEELISLQDRFPNTSIIHRYFKWNDFDKWSTSMTIVYTIIILTGLSLNVWVLFSVFTVLRRRHSRMSGVLVYIMSMTCLNLLIILSIPFIMSEFVVGYWPFSTILCRFHWIVESMNKTLMSIIMSLLSMACYCAVCQPKMRKMYENKRWSMFMVSVGVLIVFGISLPLVQNADVFYLAQVKRNSSVINLRGRKCLFQPTNEDEMLQFTMCSFICSYIIPIITMTFSYGSILYTIRFRSLFRTRGIGHFRRVVRSVFIIVCFYLGSWTPYWATTLIIHFHHNTLHVEALGLVIIAFVVHMLPYISASCSTFIYALLNKQIRTALRCKRH